VFRYSHWAGISDYTSRFRVAVTYVVIRQLELPGHCDLPDHQAGTPSPEVTELICRVPLTRLNPTRLHLFSEGHLCRFSVRTVSPFSWAPGICRVSPSRFHPVLTITVLHGPIRLDGTTVPLNIPRSVRALRLQIHGTGILTCFPFAALGLRCSLGPTNPRLTNIAEETWPLRRLGFSPNYASTIARILNATRSTGTYDPASTHAVRPPTRSPSGAPWSL
jgi:hypothetical protein